MNHPTAEAKAPVRGDGALSVHSLRYQAINADKVRSNARKLENRRERHRLRLDQLKLRKYLLGPDVLDFPIGTGRLMEFVAEHYNLYGYDVSPAFIQRAKETFPQIADRFEVQAMESISNARQFNSIYSLRVTRHIKDLPLAIASVARIVAPGGRWVFNIAPDHSDYPHLPALFEQSGMVVARCIQYDAYSGQATMHRGIGRLYALWLRLVERLPIPFWLYRLVDTLMLPFAHTILVVAEKRGPAT